jgi:hypothetical protein
VSDVAAPSVAAGAASSVFAGLATGVSPVLGAVTSAVPAAFFPVAFAGSTSPVFLSQPTEMTSIAIAKKVKIARILKISNCVNEMCQGGEYNPVLFKV